MHNSGVIRFVIFLIFLSIVARQEIAFAQTGPGGVGNSDGSGGQPINVLWLDANSLELTDGNDVSSWLDGSGNTNDFGPSVAPSSGFPTFRDGGFKYLEFDESEHDRLVKSMFTGFPGGNITTFMVFSTTDSGEGSISYAVSGQSNEYLWINSGNFSIYLDGSEKNPGTVFNDGSWRIAANRWRNSDGLITLHHNGNEETITGNTNFKTGVNLVSGGTLVIGGEQDAIDGSYQTNQDFNGNVAEVILYDAFLNDAQRIIVENYLNAKYGIAIANDYYTGDSPANDDYDYNVAGIGYDGSASHTNANSAGFIISTYNSTLNSNGEYLLAGHDNTTNATSTADLQSGVAERFEKDWYVDKTGTFDAALTFDLSEAYPEGKFPKFSKNYVLLKYNSGSSTYDSISVGGTNKLISGSQITFNVADADLTDGYYTLGTTDATASPVEGVDSKTWYVYQNGNWSNPNTWTTDASTAPLFKNPSNETPDAIDDVIIRSGRTVTIQSTTNNLTVNSIKIDGNLDLTTSIGHNFSTINGKGEIRIAGNGGSLVDNFPDGNVTENIGFADTDNGGTVVIKAAADITLNTVRTFRHMRIELVNNIHKVILGNNIALNGNLEVRNGGLQFGDGATTDRTLTVKGNVLVTDNGSTRIGSISTSNADARHTFDIKGDFTNNGEVYFTNRTDFASEADRRNPSYAYYTSEATDGIVDVFFTNDNANQTVNCNNSTFFYRLVIDKGTDQTYKVSFQSTDIDHFRLLGYANDNVDDDLQSATQNTNAFALINGTAEIGGNIEIPVLNTATNYAISSTARLWVNGGDVRKTSDTAIVPYGTVQVSAGYLEATGNSGLTLRENGLIKVEGGNVLTNQIRTSIEGAESLGGYNQSGGNVEIDGGLGGASSDYYIFSLTYTGNVFIMSGGSLTVKGANTKGLIFINSDPGNVSTTGGTVTVESSTTNAAKITSRATFYNVEITNSISSTNANARVTVSNGSSGDGGSERTIDPAPDLVVLNDLTIKTGTTRNDGTNTYGSYLDLCPDGVNCSDLDVGRNFTIEDNGVLDVFTNDADDAGSATLTFNGTENGILYVGDITSYSAALTNYDDPDSDESYIEYRFPLYNLVIDKSGGMLQLQAKNPGVEDNGNILTASGGKNLDSNNARLLYIRNGLTISSNSTLNQIDPTGDELGYIVRVYADTINIDGNLLVYEQGVNPVNSFLEVREQDQPTVGDVILINSTAGSTIGNLVVDLGNDELRLGGDLTVSRMAYRHGGVNLGTHNLKVDILDLNTESKTSDDHRLRSGNGENLFGDNTSGAEQYFFTAGNASDGGLSVKVPRITNVHGADDTENVGFDPSYDNKNNEYQNNNLIWFPIGIKDKYTPAVMYIVNDASVTYSGDEYVTVRPVDGELQTTDLSGGDILSYYWRIGHEGFDGGLPTVSWLFQYDQDDIDGGTEGNYVPGKVLDGGTYLRSYDGMEQAVKNGNTSGNGSTNDTNENHNLLGSNPGNVIIFNGLNTGNTLPLPGAVADDDIDNGTNNEVLNGTSVTGNWDPQFPNIGFTLENANYTAGEAARFVGTPEVYYSRAVDGNWWEWQSTDNWSTDDVNKHIGSPAGSVPGTGDIVVIGSEYVNSLTGGSYSKTGDGRHQIRIDGTMGDVEVAQIIFDSRDGANALDVASLSRLRVRSGITLTAGIISGKGDMAQDVGPDPSDFGTIIADIGDFVKDPDNGWFFWIQDVGTTVVNDFDVYPTFRTFGVSGNFQFAKPVTAQNALIDNETVFQVANDLTIENSLILGSNNEGYIEFIDVGSNVTLECTDIEFIGGPDSDENSITVQNAGSDEHTLIVNGDITFTNGATFDLASASGSNVILELGGNSGNNSITDNASITMNLYKIVMNKGFDVTSTFTISDFFTTIEPSVSGIQPIEIVNGLLILDDPNIDVTLTDASTGDFYLPNTNNTEASSGSGGLEIRQGVAHINGDGTGIILDGLLSISGGELDMDDGANNGNNFVEYSSSGQARIEVTDGNLIVGSQIRRGLNSNTGILQYTQSGGIVEVGKNVAPESNRGIFEVVNAGSSFEHTGGSFTLVRDNNSPTVASLLLEPDAVNIVDGTIITIGNGDTPSTQDRFGIQSSIALSEVEIASANITAKLYSLSLTTHILDIGSGVSFDANGFDLTILENLNNDGTYATSGNSTNDQLTTFEVETTATITGAGTTNFWNFEKTGSGTLDVSKHVTIDNNATIDEGTLNTQSSAFYIKKDLLHDAIHTSDQNGPGIVFNGTQQQILDRSSSGTSEFGVINLNNASGLLIRDTEENFQINEKLILTSGVFDVGGNLIIFPEDAFIENSSGGRDVDDFNVNNMIQTNSAIRDFGIRKYFNAVSGGNETFTYPVGLVAYTPVVVTINDISGGGYITARPVRDTPPIAEDIEDTDAAGTGTCTDPNITDADNVLQYYWVIKTSGITGFNGELTMGYDQNDVRVNSPYTIENYGPARLYNVDDTWDKVFSNDDFEEMAHLIHYSFINQTDATIEGIYTAGVTLENDGSSLLCGAAIPDQVPQFITNDTGGGDFFNTTSYVGGTAPVSGETPDITIKSGDELTFDQNNIRTRKITIESGGTLVIQNGTNNHNLGFVTGEGTIRLESNDNSIAFPTGDYEEFFPDENCSGGGGLEYAGGGSYPVLSDLPNIRRVIFSGSGTRTLPNGFALNICEDFDVRDNVIIEIGSNNTTIIRGNVYKSDASSFENGGGSSRVVMEGSSAQSIQGSFTAGNAFNELEIDNAAGVTIVNSADVTRSISANQDIIVNETLVLTNGVLTTNSNNTLTIASGGTYTGGNAASYINGPFTQNNIVTNATYQFPIGKNGRYLPATISNVGTGNQNWTAQYFTTNSKDVNQLKVDDEGYGELGSVSSADMWNITSSGSNSARVRLAYGSHTGVSDVNETRVVIWDGTQWVNEGGVVAGSITSGTVTAEAISGFSSKDFSIGATSTSPLPVELISFSAKIEDKWALLNWVTASEKNNDFFEIHRSVNGQDWKLIGTVKGAGDSHQEFSYTYTDKYPLYGVSYYRLRQVDFDGQFEFSKIVVLENFENNEFVLSPELLLMPNPASLDGLIIRGLNLHPWEEVEVSLADVNGKQYVYEKVEPEALEQGIKLTHHLDLPSGLYIVMVRQSNIWLQKKLILKK